MSSTRRPADAPGRIAARRPQWLVRLLLDRPGVLTAVLAPVARPGSMRHARIRPAAATFTNLSPPSYHADLVLRAEDARGRLQELFIGEVQLRRDRRKHKGSIRHQQAARACREGSIRASIGSGGLPEGG